MVHPSPAACWLKLFYVWLCLSLPQTTMTRTAKTKTWTRTTRRVWLRFSSSRLSTSAPRLSTRLVGRVCLSYCWASLFVVIIGATAIVSHESQNLICVQAHPGSLPFLLPPPSYRAALNGDSNKPFRKTVKCCSYQTASSPTPCLISPLALHK